jgi:hypothetical protein
MWRLGLVSLLALSVLPAAGCGVIGFDVSQDIPDTVIMGDPTAGVVVGANDTPLTLDIQAETQQRHSGPASSAHLKDLSFTIKLPDGAVFDFVDAVSILLIPKNPMSRLKTVKIAELLTVPHERTIHITPVPNVDILPYSNEGATIQATAVGHFPAVDTTYSGHVVVEVRI